MRGPVIIRWLVKPGESFSTNPFFLYRKSNLRDNGCYLCSNDPCQSGEAEAEKEPNRHLQVHVWDQRVSRKICSRGMEQIMVCPVGLPNLRRESCKVFRFTSEPCLTHAYWNVLVLGGYWSAKGWKRKCYLILKINDAQAYSGSLIIWCNTFISCSHNTELLS